jgi:hypothetical protein
MRSVSHGTIKSCSAAVADIDRWLDADGALPGHQDQHEPCLVRLDRCHSCTLDAGRIPASGPVRMYMEEGNHARGSGVCNWSKCCWRFVRICQSLASVELAGTYCLEAWNVVSRVLLRLSQNTLVSLMCSLPSSRRSKWIRDCVCFRTAAQRKTYGPFIITE